MRGVVCYDIIVTEKLSTKKQYTQFQKLCIEDRGTHKVLLLAIDIDSSLEMGREWIISLKGVVPGGCITLWWMVTSSRVYMQD